MSSTRPARRTVRSGRRSARRPSEVDGTRHEVEGAWERIFTRRGGCRPARHLKSPDAFPSGRRVGGGGFLGGEAVPSGRHACPVCRRKWIGRGPVDGSRAPRARSEMDGAPCKWRARGCGAFFGEVRSKSNAPSDVDGPRLPVEPTWGRRIPRRGPMGW